MIMKFSILALDYDGTIARDGRADPAVLEAITEARARQIVMWMRRITSSIRLTSDNAYTSSWRRTF